MHILYDMWALYTIRITRAMSFILRKLTFQEMIPFYQSFLSLSLFSCEKYFSELMKILFIDLQDGSFCLSR